MTEPEFSGEVNWTYTITKPGPEYVTYVLPLDLDATTVPPELETAMEKANVEQGVPAEWWDEEGWGVYLTQGIAPYVSVFVDWSKGVPA